MADMKQPLTGSVQRYTAEDLKELPVTSDRRKCHDVSFCILFALYWVGMLAVGFHSFVQAGGTNGYRRLTNGAQFDGQICGLGALKTMQYVYWPTPGNDTLSICLSGCPSAGSHVCANVLTGKGSATTLVCWDTTYDSKELYHYCVPTDAASSYAVTITERISSESYGRAMADLGQTWPVLLAAAGIAVIVGFIYLWLLWFLGPCLVYSTIFVLIGAGALAGFLLIHRSASATSDSARDGLKWAGIGICIADAIFLIICIALRKSIALAVTCLKQATVAIASMKRILLLPLVKFVLVALATAWSVLSSVYLVSAGEISTKLVSVPGTDFTVPEKSIQFDSTMRYAGLYTFFGYLWTVAFLLALADVIIAGAVGRWYFTPEVNNEKRLHSPIVKSVSTAMRHHLGSIALGSFVLAVIWLIKWLIRFAASQAKKVKDPTGIRKFVVCCLMCCVRCFECCIKFLSRQAYIQMAIFGGSFCSSARHAFSLITRNAGSMAAITLIGSVFSVMGVCLVMAATGIATYFMLGAAYDAHELSSMMTPLVVSVIVAFAVGQVFMTVLDMAINTILHCFVADEEAHDGVAQYLPGNSKLAHHIHEHVAKHRSANEQE